MIKAENKSLRDLLDKNKYQVDPFQREYKWEREHIEELIVDLERAFSKNFDSEHTVMDASNYSIYYLGPIILYEKDGTNHLIDGQQRLTSLTLLLIHLRHLQKKILDTESWDDFDTLIISKVLLSKTFNLEINDRTAVLKKIFDGEVDSAEGDSLNDSSRTIVERYKDIEDLFPPSLSGEDVLPLFIYWIQRKLSFTEIRAFDDENAYTIFETMNDRGLQLTPSEMLKSYLLVKVKDPERLDELNEIWKTKVSELRKIDRVEEDLNFFKAWLRAKYASRQGKEGDDFERIGNRFHYWVKDNDKAFGLNHQEDYYFFVKTNFVFFVDLYLEVRYSQLKTDAPEDVLRFSYLKGVSSSLSIPLILSSITVIDSKTVIGQKIKITSQYLDSYAVYRMLVGESISQSSINYTFNNLILEVRNTDQHSLQRKFSERLSELQERYDTLTYIPYDRSFAKYLLARIYKHSKPDVPFEDVYFQRRKESLVLYQFLKPTDVDPILNKISSKLKDLFYQSLTTYCLVPKAYVSNYDKQEVVNRIKLLSRNGFLPEMDIDQTVKTIDFQKFFILRNKLLKSEISLIWPINLHYAE